MVSTDVLRNEHASRGFLSEAWRLARQAPKLPGRPCPICSDPMRKVDVASGVRGRELPKGLELDVCLSCACIWLDRGEYDEVPRDGAAGEGSPSDADVCRGQPARAVEPPGRADAKEGRAAGTKRTLDAPPADEAKQKRDAATRKGPDAGWKYLPAILLYPVECGMEAPSRRPWVTWGLTALIVSVFVFSVAMGPDFFNGMGEAWGFVPSAWLRLGGLTLLTGFFIHAGLLHLLGNSYFLMVFGDNVEDNIGRGRYVWLILAAHLAGYTVHGLFDSDPNRFLVGASAGISGVIAYYATAFPRAKLGFLFFLVKWFHLPAWGAFVLWVIVQVFTARLQTKGEADVSGLAHLGGAGVGVVAALALRKRRRPPGAAGKQSRADAKGPDLVRDVAGSTGSGSRKATAAAPRGEDPRTDVRRPRAGCRQSRLFAMPWRLSFS
jgi:membrane associated rhomboid family serine protease/Zn-finger nucleic acid-binding protein